ncbi:helix-turn-helix domain-containing protein [Paraburkholderia sp. MM6662-R1]|uniref:helix-turn-helix domain-containing protein n=1 Tax=Paraburkholderia sp. MM6662-R1 TaxID=2991066 RepID=UPI003D1BA520
MPETFGARLVAERERMGLAQGDMKAIAGVSRRAQFNYEQSVRLPDVGYLAALAMHGFDVAYLVTGKRSSRYGAIDEGILCRVFVAIDAGLPSAGRSIDAAKMAKLISLIYQSASETGEVDPLLVQKAIALVS